MDEAPRLDSRSFDEVVAQTEALATAYTTSSTSGPWRPRADGTLDFGSVLIRLFATMADQLIKQLDRVPGKHQLAFTQLLGARRVPARAARAPITFTAAEGTEPVEVPAGAQIAATTPAGAATFETESALPLTRAQLRACFVRDVLSARYADRTNDRGPFFALAAPAPLIPGNDPANRAIEHLVYLEVDTLLTRLGATNLKVFVTGELAVPPEIAWSSAGSGIALPASMDGNVQTLEVSDLTLITPYELNGVTRRWLVGSVPAPEVDTHVMLWTRVGIAASQGVSPDAGFFNAQKVDFTRDVQPFGERPRFNDAFYIASEEAFSLESAVVTIDAVIAVPPSGINDSSDLALQWEAWSAQGWQKVTPESDFDSTKAFTEETGTITLVLNEIPRSTIGGVQGRWLRVRIVAGNYGQDVRPGTGSTVIAADFGPPAFSSLRLSWSGEARSFPASVQRRTALTYEDLSEAVSQSPVSIFREAPELVYLAEPDPNSSLYLGFDRAFEPHLTTLYVPVFAPPPPAPSHGEEPPERKPPQVVWEYWSENENWTRLRDLSDDTRGFARSGVVRFHAPPDATASELFGQRLWWMRARALSLAFDPVPRVGRILTNTIWAVNSRAHVNETIGASNGDRSQSFKLSSTPVLEGQRIEVGEPERPPSSELARLQQDDHEVVVTREDHPKRPPIYWVRWQEVADFWGSGPRDRHYTFDANSGEVRFGDGTRGMIPASGRQNVRAASYRSGGGPVGNVDVGAITQLKTTIPMVEAATNSQAAVGGAAIEPEAAMMERASRTLRHRGRAVTAQDFADLALESSRAIARAVALTPGFSPISQGDGPDLGPEELFRDGRVIVVIVPTTVRAGEGPDLELLTTVEDYLRARCAPGVRVRVIGPSWVAVDITMEVAATSLADSDATVVRVRDALVRLFDPITGGEGAGWDFGRRPHTSDLIACITGVTGVDYIAHLGIDCAAPFDAEDPTKEVSIDELSLQNRLLVYARSVTVTAATAGVP